ncbi:MAG TPA: methionine--tRNA ligase [Ilumatobacteraceae bacterium]
MSTYLTVAIPYVNADPHLGYAYELVHADTAARARRARGEPVRFLGGTDDHSLKNVLAAERAGVPTASFVDERARRFEELAHRLGITFDDFIRTSRDERHAPAVERLWRSCAANGDLYRSSYVGDYCVGCEQFHDVGELPDGRCPEHGSPLERVAEDNWYFRLSAYGDRLLQQIASGALEITPQPFRDEVVSFVERGLDDISVSRTVHRARGWGIPVPDDPGQVVSVWFDALTNYVSALDFGDPSSEPYRTWWREANERIHVIGKGILRFHAVYWPAFLLSAGEPIPTRIQVHPYLTVEGSKLSKSSGNAVDPFEVADVAGVDALRWWCTAGVSPIADTDFTWARLVDLANNDLANGVGNTVNRVTALVRRSARRPAAGAAPIASVDGLSGQVATSLGEFDHRHAAGLVTSAVGSINQLVESTQPWRWIDDPARESELDELLGTLVESVREVARAIEPITPELALAARHHLDDVGPVAAPPAFPRIDPAVSGARVVATRAE